MEEKQKIFICVKYALLLLSEFDERFEYAHTTTTSGTAYPKKISIPVVKSFPDLEQLRGCKRDTLSAVVTSEICSAN